MTFMSHPTPADASTRTIGEIEAQKVADDKFVAGFVADAPAWHKRAARQMALDMIRYSKPQPVNLAKRLDEIARERRA